MWPVETKGEHVGVATESAGKDAPVKHMMNGLEITEKIVWHPGSRELVYKRTLIV